jgi:hypothetical protein
MNTSCVQATSTNIAMAIRQDSEGKEMTVAMVRCPAKRM